MPRKKSLAKKSGSKGVKRSRKHMSSSESNASPPQNVLPLQAFSPPHDSSPPPVSPSQSYRPGKKPASSSSVLQHEIRDVIRKKVIATHYHIDYAFFKKRFSRVLAALEFQGWLNFLTFEAPIYENFVREFYSNFRLDRFEDGNCFIETTVLDRKIVITEALIASLLNVESGGVVFNDSYCEQLGIESDIQLLKLVFRPLGKLNSTPPANKLTFENKIFHFLFGKCLFPITSSFNVVSYEHCFLMHHIRIHVKIDLPKLIMCRMQQSLKISTYSLPYGALISRILEHFNFKLEGPLIKPRTYSQIGSKTLNQMGAKVSHNNTIEWEDMVVTGPNFAPLPFEPYVTPPTTPPTTDESAPPSPVATHSRSFSHRSSKFSVKEMLFDLLGGMCRTSKQIRNIRKDIRDVKEHLGRNVADDPEAEEAFRLNDDLYDKYYGGGGDGGHGDDDGHGDGAGISGS